MIVTKSMVNSKPCQSKDKWETPANIFFIQSIQNIMKSVKKSGTYKMLGVHIPIEPEHEDNIVSMEPTPVNDITWKCEGGKSFKFKIVWN